jgi:hypothetical protein
MLGVFLSEKRCLLRRHDSFVVSFYMQIFINLNGCHSDNGGISVLFDKLSGKDVSFVDMTAGEASHTKPNHALPIIIGTEGEGSFVL